MFDLTFALTKRHLGLLLMAAGLLLGAALLIMELLENDGIGTLQQIGAAAALLAVVVGGSLLPLGARPA